MGKTRDRLPGSIRDLMKNNPLAVLATCSGAKPYTSLIGFAFSEDFREIYFATLKNTSKYRNIRNHPGISLLIDSRSNSPADFKNAKALTVLGEAAPLAGGERREKRRLYLRRFPQLKDFLDGPGCELMRIRAEKYIFVEKFQKSGEINVP